MIRLAGAALRPLYQLCLHWCRLERTRIDILSSLLLLLPLFERIRVLRSCWRVQTLGGCYSCIRSQFSLKTRTLGAVATKSVHNSLHTLQLLHL